jgi:hypothetical protein
MFLSFKSPLDNLAEAAYHCCEIDPMFEDSIATSDDRDPLPNSPLLARSRFPANIHRTPNRSFSAPWVPKNVACSRFETLAPA